MSTGIKTCIVLLAPCMIVACFVPEIRVGVLSSGVLLLVVIWQEASAMQRRINRLESDWKKETGHKHWPDFE
jgi:hypothetical protein